MPKENIKHLEAFDYYYGLGEERSYMQVSDKYGISMTTVGKWGKVFNWVQRVKDRDQANIQRRMDLTDEDIVAEKVQYRKIIKATIGKFLEELKAGGIKITSVNDLYKLVELDMKLMGVDLNLIKKLRGEESEDVETKTEVTFFSDREMED